MTPREYQMTLNAARQGPVDDEYVDNAADDILECPPSLIFNQSISVRDDGGLILEIPQSLLFNYSGSPEAARVATVYNRMVNNQSFHSYDGSSEARSKAAGLGITAGGISLEEDRRPPTRTLTAEEMIEDAFESDRVKKANQKRMGLDNPPEEEDDTSDFEDILDTPSPVAAAIAGAGQRGCDTIEALG
jgi:hypothetical protein